MEKKKFVKLFLAIMVIATLTIFLSGCIIIFGEKTTVHINVDDDSAYEIYVDGDYYGTTNSQGELTLDSVSTGLHRFEAKKDTSDRNYYGSKWKWIKKGFNTVNIYIKK